MQCIVRIYSGYQFTSPPMPSPPMPDLYQSYTYGTFVQTLLYGTYVTTFAHCLRWLLLDDEGWKLRRRTNWSMLIISILLFLFSTADLALTLQLLVNYNNLHWGRIYNLFVGWIRPYCNSPNTSYPIGAIIPGVCDSTDYWRCSGTFISIMLERYLFDFRRYTVAGRCIANHGVSYIYPSCYGLAVWPAWFLSVFPTVTMALLPPSNDSPS